MYTRLGISLYVLTPSDTFVFFVVLWASPSTRYGDAVVLVASQEIRERVLFREDKTHYRDMSLVQYCILEVVGAARHYGILRNDLTKQFLKIDPRSTFHHCRTLENFGLLKVTVITVHSKFLRFTNFWHCNFFGYIPGFKSCP